MKKTTLLLTALWLLPTMASAHNLVLYVSTPITPPREFIWWLPLSVSILGLGAFGILWRVLDRRWPLAILLSATATTFFATTFFLFGHYAANLTTEPPPGLGLPCSTFWGLGWEHVGILFVRWNIYGYLFLLGSILLCGGFTRAKAHFRRLAPLTLALYLAGLIPYVMTGALSHGWGGGYIHVGCERRLERLSFALVEYADQHSGRLPTADGLKSLLPQITPYMPQDRVLYSQPVNICPLGEAYERNPKTYVWNTKFSGVRLLAIDPDQFLQNAVPLSCPYHQRAGVRAAFKATERMTNEKCERPPRKQ